MYGNYSMKQDGGYGERVGVGWMFSDRDSEEGKEFVVLLLKICLMI